VSGTAAVYHYAPDRHALERRCTFDDRAGIVGAGAESVVLVALTSIHWREAWKYGERAFRYCQHDMGHAIAALTLAAALLGWRAVLLRTWPHDVIAALCGIDRDEDFVEAEREEPGCVLAIGSGGGLADLPPDAGSSLVAAVRAGSWAGRANQLSEDHVQWTFIDEIAESTRDAGVTEPSASSPDPSALPVLSVGYTRRLLLQRRSALAFDARSTLPSATFFDMLARTMPSNEVPFGTLWWPASVHLALFVHRVDGLAPGMYLLARRNEAAALLQAALTRDFLWARVHDDLALFCLARGDCRGLARRLSCDQDIAADGFFSLGMIAEFDGPLARQGPSFYRHLFWESGVVGQVLYLEAEAAGTRATGIGCFFDDPVHDVLGLRDHALQSLYHFTIGMPVEDTRLQTTSGYSWEERPTQP
jgi:nitroreductase